MKKEKTEDALVFLGIDDFRDRIFNSNSHGELGHLMDYSWFASGPFKDHPEFFRIYFLMAVDFAEKNWKRPESVFQHMPEMIKRILGVQ